MFNDRTTPIPGSFQALSGTGVNSLTVPADANTALVVPEADARWRDDGTNPTGSVGMLVKANTALFLQGGLQLAKFKIIAVTGSLSGAVSYYQQSAR